MLSGLLLRGTLWESARDRAEEEEASIKPLSKERSWEDGLEMRCRGLFGFLGLCF